MGAKTTRSKCATGTCRLYQRGRVRLAKERAVTRRELGSVPTTVSEILPVTVSDSP